jgi:hypothetical protein
MKAFLGIDLQIQVVPGHLFLPDEFSAFQELGHGRREAQPLDGEGEHGVEAVILGWWDQGLEARELRANFAREELLGLPDNFGN